MKKFAFFAVIVGALWIGVATASASITVDGHIHQCSQASGFCNGIAGASMLCQGYGSNGWTTIRTVSTDSSGYFNCGTLGAYASFRVLGTKTDYGSCTTWTYGPSASLANDGTFHHLDLWITNTVHQCAPTG
jgi:hypothetical protein